jgi:hypothetical protein
MPKDPPPKQEGKGKRIESVGNSTGNNIANSTGDGKRAEKIEKLYELTDYHMGSEIPDD